MKKKRGFTITVKVPKRTGHVPPRSGAGVHEDRRTKRNRTRERRIMKAMREWN